MDQAGISVYAGPTQSNSPTSSDYVGWQAIAFTQFTDQIHKKREEFDTLSTATSTPDKRVNKAIANIKIDQHKLLKSLNNAEDKVLANIRHEVRMELNKALKDPTIMESIKKGLHDIASEAGCTKRELETKTHIIKLLALSKD